MNYKLQFSYHNFVRKGRNSLKLIILPSIDYLYLGSTKENEENMTNIMGASSIHILTFSWISIGLSCRLTIS